jgi:hypothetical protein
MRSIYFIQGSEFVKHTQNFGLNCTIGNEKVRLDLYEERTATGITHFHMRISQHVPYGCQLALRLIIRSWTVVFSKVN